MKEYKNIYFLNSEKLPEISEVGGKGYSLIRLSSLNLNVPNGIVLTVNFFNDWITQIKNTELYTQFLDLSKNNNISQCSSILNQIKEWCLSNLSLSKESLQEVEQSIKSIFPNDYNDILYAVRSSSPEEDLFGASFAGNYETYLGIHFDSFEPYILKSFISCIDFRVFKYKLEKGFDASDIKIAIVIMKQINCDVSGVGFSINPLNNDYDEAVITSNFGLGESVVAGIITPDEYIVNKLTKKIISQKLGSKDKVVKLNLKTNETSIVKQTEENQKLSSLSEEFLIKIVENIITIEENYEIPIDIEFGIENNDLYILQARPITTFNQIPKEILTEKGEKRKMFLDVTIAVQGFEKPMSTLGSSILKIMFGYLGNKVFGSNNFCDVNNSVIDCIGGKLLFNCSNVTSKVSPKTLSKIGKNINNHVGEIISKYGEDYKSPKVCPEIDVNIFGMMKRLPVRKILFYKHYAPSTKRSIEIAFDKFFNDNEKYVKEYCDTVPVTKILGKMSDEITTIFRDYFLPAIFTGAFKGFFTINKIFDESFIKEHPEIKGDLNNLTKSLPYVTILMGLDLYKLTKHLDKSKYSDSTTTSNIGNNRGQEQFYQDFINKKLPKEFYDDYDLFVKKYGFRCEGELDVMSERYYENPRPLVNQIYSSLMNTDENNNPQKDYDEANAKRPEVFERLKQVLIDNKKSNKTIKTFEKAYNNTIQFLQYRESPKYYIIFIISKIKEIILKKTKSLIEKNLIKDMDEISKLNIRSLNDIFENEDKYTREQIEEQMKRDNEMYEVFNSWNRTGLMFDSRGRIFTAEKKVSDKKNELIGDTVSFGKIRGKAKVLNSVNEKEFKPGEILVTKATDPGWTPLIINCGGIILEVGGMLQHGALVSREFNKPCVVGIENVTKIIKDGEEIEVDAIDGIVRLLDREE